MSGLDQPINLLIYSSAFTGKTLEPTAGNNSESFSPAPFELEGSYAAFSATGGQASNAA